MCDNISEGTKTTLDKECTAVVDFLNVGFGESTVIRLIGGSTYTIVVDGGDDDSNTYKKNSNRIRLIEYLKRECIDFIDLLIITHPHRDHIGGLLEVVKKIDIKEVWYNIIFSNALLDANIQVSNNKMAYAADLYQRVLKNINKKNTAQKLIRKKELVEFGDMKLVAFPPQKALLSCLERNICELGFKKDPRLYNSILKQIDAKMNAVSMVVKVNIGKIGLLLTSDVPISYWDYVRDSEDLRANILKAPHHGDIQCLTEDFLRAVEPQYVVISADDEYTYQLPSRNLEALIKSVTPAIRVLYTTGDALSMGRQHLGIRFMIRPDGGIDLKQL